MCKVWFKQLPPFDTHHHFEKLVLHYFKNKIPASPDPQQFAFRTNLPTKDAISSAFHEVVTHLKGNNGYIRMLFVYFSSAFNSSSPIIMLSKFTTFQISSHFSFTLVPNRGTPGLCAQSSIVNSVTMPVTVRWKKSSGSGSGIS